MQIPLQITIRNMTHSEALVREKVQKLETFYPELMGCRVVVEEEQRRRQQGKLFNVRLHVTMPGGEVAVNRDRDEDVYVALRDAFDTAKRQLEDFARKQRGQVKSHEVPQRGRVKRLVAEEGYGFIETPDGRELYFSRENVVNPSFDRLEEGTDVQFLEEIAAQGAQAKRVTAGKHHAP
jgi:ribosomal subunit interface protein